MKEYLKILSEKIPDYYEITACEQVPQGDLSSLPGMPMRDVPEHIRICVTARPEPGSNIRIELWLPVVDWNGDLVGVGNGGAAGVILPLMLVGPLRLGFSVVTTDLGTSDGPDCGIGNEAVWRDFGFRATHLMTVFAKLATSLYYGKPVRKAFFMGGSTGGQQAFSEAQRYPEDYDGILACAPAYDRVNLHLAFLHDWQVLNAPGVKAFTADDEKKIMHAFLKECAKEGGRQGEDAFFYRPDRIRVTRDVLEKAGLSEPQIEALRKVYEGTEDIYEPTLTPGSETSGFGIAHRCEKENFAKGYFYLFRWVLGAEFDFEQFDFEKDGKTVKAALEASLSATAADLAPFRDHGGKLLLMHGTADPIIPMTSSIRYYKTVQDRMGDVQDFFRLFLVPGMAHLSGGPGLQDIFYGLPATPKDEKHLGLLALKAWVEDGKAPDKLYPVAFKNDDPLSAFRPDGLAWEREITPYRFYNPFDYETLSKLPLTVDLCEELVAEIQTAIYKGKAINSFAPFREPKRFVKANGQYIVTEIRYGDTFMNSYLDITYPSADTPMRFPVVFYTHGGGFFGGSKTMGDPLAVGDTNNFMFEDIVESGFTFVNVDYVLTPEGHFPDPLRQLAEAIDFCAAHADELNLNMSRIAVMGSSAGAILTAQYGALLANPAYRDRLHIYPKADPSSVRCLVIDDAPLRTESFNWKMRSMMGNYLQTTDMSSDTALSYNAYAFFHADMKPCFFDAGPLDGFPEDMLACGEKLDGLGVENEVFLPREKLPHGFLTLAREKEEAADCEKRIIAFLKKHTKES